MGKKTTYQELEQQLEFYKKKNDSELLLKIAGVIFIELNVEGIVTLVNQKASEVFGYTESEMLGKNWFENFLPERIRNEVLPISKKLLSGEIEMATYYENPILTKNGEERLISWHNTAIKDENNVIIGHLSSGEDITERKKIEEALKISEERFKQLSNFTFEGILIHDKGVAIDLNKSLKSNEDPFDLNILSFGLYIEILIYLSLSCFVSSITK